ncbi:MAG: hypothetical protein BGO78_01480 [Chloroflexi bacterium 44-23]|nr:MAG: hypothetical protein BGO78_01480 [Chloroflexi bacterium 44-23]
MTKVLIRGGGDLGSGIALRLFRAGLKVAIFEIANPLVLRRTVAFANAIYLGKMQVEEVKSQRAENLEQVFDLLDQNMIPVFIKSDPVLHNSFPFEIVVDARMLKEVVPYKLNAHPYIIGLGPGFTAPVNCHAAIETNRGHFLGRVILKGSPETDTRKPGAIANQDIERVLRAPKSGIIHSGLELGTLVVKNTSVAYVNDTPVVAPISGILRGLMHDGIQVAQGIKIGDVDPRADKRYLDFVSEKSLAIAGGVLEAILATGKFNQWN